MKKLSAISTLFALATAAYAADPTAPTLVAAWDSFSGSDLTHGNYTLNLGGASVADGKLLLSSTSAASLTGGPITSTYDSGTAASRLESAVTMTISSLTLAAGNPFVLFRETDAGASATSGSGWGLGVNTAGSPTAIWGASQWNNANNFAGASAIDFQNAVTLTFTFNDTGSSFYINGVQQGAAMGGLRGSGANWEKLFIGGADSNMQAGEFEISNLYVHTGTLNSAGVLDFYNTTVIPEPSTYAFAGALAFVGLIAVRAYRRKGEKK